MERILAALGVKDEAEALQAITTFNHLLSSLQETTGTKELGQILPAVRATASIGVQLKELTGAEGQAALGAIAGFKAEASKVPSLKTEIETLRLDATKHDADKRAARVMALLAEAQEKGTVTPAEAPSLQAAGEKDDAGVAWLEGNLAVRSPVVATAVQAVQPTTAPTGTAALHLSALEMKYAKAAGMSPEAYAAEKKLLAAEKANRPADEDEES